MIRINEEKRGFTLIELLAILLLLGILFLIAIPLVTNIIKEARDKVCVLDAGAMEKAADNYVSHDGIIIKTGESRIITLKELQTAGYMKEVVSPYSKKTSCTGYVVVKNSGNAGNDYYTYQSELKCGTSCQTADYDVSKDDTGTQNNTTDPDSIKDQMTQKNNDWYFDGSNPNNWVKFGMVDGITNKGILWRIVKIDSTGIKMVYEGLENGDANPLEDGRALIDGTMGISWNKSGSNQWNEPASLEGKLNEWLSNLNIPDVSNYLAKINWKVGGVPYQSPTTIGTFTQYQGIDSTNTGGSFSGLSKNTSYVGTINAVDFMYTSDNDNCVNSYLETGSTNECAYDPTSGDVNNFLQKYKYLYWTLNARSDVSNMAWDISNSGLIGSNSVKLSTISVRPVLNLKLDSKFISGTGTIEDPYILEDYMVGLTDKPVITLNGDSTVYVRQYDTYEDEGATATDTQDGDISSNIKLTGTVNTNTPGEYTIEYNVKDSDGNAAVSVTRKVVVVERDTPLIELNGSNPTHVVITTPYTEAGATAYDINYGDISSSIVISGNVDTSVLGTYYIKYNVSNEDGIKAPEVTRKVIVEVPTPKITLNGDDTVLVDIGTSYTEAGATATDEADGDLTSSIIKTIEYYNDSNKKWQFVSSINTSALGKYRIKYSVTNSYGANAYIYRNVQIVKVDGPIITYTPNGSETSKQKQQTVINIKKRNYDIVTSSQKFLIKSNWSSVDINNIDNYKTSYVDGQTITPKSSTGYYTIYARAFDTYGDLTLKASGRFKVDTSKPYIYINGGTERVLIGHTYVDKGATAYDDYYDGNLTSKIITTSNVNTSVLGTYYVTYKVTDSAGNTTSKSRKVVVYHSQPKIYLKGGSSINLLYGTPYTEAGATAYDEVDGDLTSSIVETGSVNSTKEGTYNLTYTATNSSGFSASRTRTVNVYIPAPVITLNGSSSIKLLIHSTYKDAGATAVDTLDGDLTSRIVITGSVNPEVAGNYTITYTVTNNLGKTSSITRKVTVYQPVPQITITGGSVELLKTKPYTDLGATATDEIDGDITSKIQVTSDVNINKAGSYNVTYTVTNSEGIVATKQRSVVVREPKLVLTITGGSAEVIKTKSYTDLGATATDEIDGDITSKIQVTSNLNINKAGTYYITYKVTDSTGNTAVENRKVVVREPLLTLTLNGGDAELLKTLTYVDQGATAIDEIDGDITNKISISTNINVNKAGTYTVTYTVLDSTGNTATKTRNVVVREPVVEIALNGDASVDLSIGKNYFDQGATATDELLGDVTSKITTTNNINPYTLGKYTVTYTITSSGITKTVSRAVNVISLPGPVITFSKNGDGTYKKTNSTTVTVTKGDYNVDNSSLKYIWNTSSTDPAESEFGTSFSSGDNISVPAGVTGKYYLHIIAKDTYGNTSIFTSNAFCIDNLKPVLTLKGPAVYQTPVDGTYSDPGVNIVEDDSGIDSNGVVTTSTIVTGVIGTYTVTYTATDKAGNVSDTIKRTVSVIEASLKDAPSADFVQLYDASYFVGSNPNNWVEFGNAADNIYDYIPIMWRIIKADDNGIKIVYEGVKNAAETGTIQNGTIGTGIFDNTNNIWNKPVTIKTSLDNFFTNLNETDKATLTSSINWCVGLVNTPYSLDAFKDGECTTTGSSVSPVGLISGKDYILTSKDPCSGYNEASCGTNNFLTKSYSYFTSSGDATNSLAVFIANSNGGLTRTQVSDTMNIRPVVNLRSDVLILGGEGTFDNPYKLNSRTPRVDNDPPVVTFSPTSSSTKLDEAKIEVVVTDTVTGVNDSSLKYLWTTSSTAPSEAAITNSFTNGSKIDLPTSPSGKYYLWVVAYDNKGNKVITKGGSYLVDTDAPVITMNGDSTVKIPVNSSYTDAGATAIDNTDGDLTSNIKMTSNIIPTIPGTYYVKYNVSDNAGNKAIEAVRKVIVYETTPPTIAFTPTSNASYTKKINVKVTVSDNDAVNESSLRYVWTTSNIQPSTASINNSFANSSNIPSPDGVVGDYYLWVYAEDQTGNLDVESSGVYHIDSLAPVITLNGNASVTMIQNGTYVDQGATALDSVDGNLTSSITTTSDINPSVVGSYTVTYTVTDACGNQAVATRTVIVDTVSNSGLIQAIGGIDYADGDQTIAINGVSYDVEFINVLTDTTYTASTSLGNSTADARILIVKYHGNLTINSGVTITSAVRKKGLIIYVAGTLTNSGTITMTARGAKATGQNVYLWKYDDGSYDYIPAVGGAGAASFRGVTGFSSTQTQGKAGTAGTLRGTGGGGTGGAVAGGYAGAGSAGTSYSGGTGGGGGYNNATGGNGVANGGAGGAGAGNAVYTWSCGGGAGNPGGAGANGGAAGTAGTGGLLVIKAYNVINNGTISSNGSAGGTAYRTGGGGTGGGSVNIFYNGSLTVGTMTATGGAGGTATRSGENSNGGAGGAGVVTKTKVSG